VMVDEFHKSNAVGSLLLVQPTASFDIVGLSSEGKVREVSALSQSDIWINGGFFVFRKEIFRYINPGDDLVRQPFQRLIAKGALLAHKCTSFWQCMDTFKDKQCLEELNHGKAPWKVWEHASTVISNQSAKIPAGA
jgi:glucose-1-phosphate cytidylyltransferase